MRVSEGDSLSPIHARHSLRIQVPPRSWENSLSNPFIRLLSICLNCVTYSDKDVSGRNASTNKLMVGFGEYGRK